MEYDGAMTEWMKTRQPVVFHADFDNLLSTSRHRTILVRQLHLFLDDGGLAAMEYDGAMTEWMKTRQSLVFHV